MTYDRWKTRSPDDDIYHAGDEKPDPEAERADYEDRMAQLCIACASGNDLPEGEKCSLCHRVGPAIHDHGLRLRDVSNTEVRAAISSDKVRDYCKSVFDWDPGAGKPRRHTLIRGLVE